MKTWSRKYKQCIQCGQNDTRHVSQGLCNKCYQKKYKSDPVKKATVDAQKTAWYFRYHKENLLKNKIAREERWFDGKRDIVLARDSHKCTKCGSLESLVVHHKDGFGRGKSDPNNSDSNLTTLCRSCHIAVHKEQLYATRRKHKI